MPDNISTSTRVGFTLDTSAAQENKKYSLGKIVFVNNEDEKGIYIGQGDDTNPITIFSSKNTVSNAEHANTATTAYKLSSGTVGGVLKPIYFSDGVPTEINFSFSTLPVNILTETTIISQNAVESLINTKIENIPQVLRFRGYVSDLNSVATPHSGDVVMIGESEWVFVKDENDENDNGKWQQFGNENEYLYKTNAAITGDNIVIVDGSFQASPINISIKHATTNVFTQEDYTAQLSYKTFGSSTEMPILRINEYGHVASVSTVSIFNPLDGYGIVTSDFVGTPIDGTTIITQKLITNKIESTASSLTNYINGQIASLATAINNLGSIEYIGQFPTTPTILYDSTEDKYYFTYNNEDIDVNNGDIISLIDGTQYILHIDKTNHTGSWEIWGNSDNYVLKEAVHVIGTGILTGGGSLNANVEISHLAATVSSTNIGDNNSYLNLDIDQYGHIVNATTLPDKLSGITIATSLEQFDQYNMPPSTAIIFTQSGVEEIVRGEIELLGGSVLNYRGLVSDLNSVATPQKGDVVILTNSNSNNRPDDRTTEYIYVIENGIGRWESFGHIENWAYNNVQIIGTGVLGGGGDLTQNREIYHNTSTATAGTYGDENIIPEITIDQYGHIISATTHSLVIPTYSGPSWEVDRNYSYDEHGQLFIAKEHGWVDPEEDPEPVNPIWNNGN